MSSPMRKAIYPGTFDPVTRGHEDLVRRAASLFDAVLIAIAASPSKAPMFNLDERVQLAREVFADMPNVSVTSYSGLTVEFARTQGHHVIVRGLRAVSDFEFEFQLANMGRHIAAGVETIFLTPKENFTFVSSTLVREIASLGGNVAEFVHPSVEAAFRRKLGKK